VYNSKKKKKKEKKEKSSSVEIQFEGSVLRGIRGQRREESKWPRQKDIYDQRIEQGKRVRPEKRDDTW